MRLVLGWSLTRLTGLLRIAGTSTPEVVDGKAYSVPVSIAHEEANTSVRYNLEMSLSRDASNFRIRAGRFLRRVFDTSLVVEVEQKCSVSLVLISRCLGDTIHVSALVAADDIRETYLAGCWIAATSTM